MISESSSVIFGFSANWANDRYRLSCVYASTADKSPARETSIPLVPYGRCSNRLPLPSQLADGTATYFLASCSILYPGLGSFLSPMTRAKRSRQFPIAISSVSPNILYRCWEYAMTCVLPPETYRTIGLCDDVICRPISISYPSARTHTSGGRRIKTLYSRPTQ